MPLSHSFYQVEGNVSVSCLKLSEDGTGLTLRLFNQREEKEQAKVWVAGLLKQALLLDLKEDVTEEIPVEKGNVEHMIELEATSDKSKSGPWHPGGGEEACYWF